MHIKSISGNRSKQRLPVVGGSQNPGQPTKQELSGMAPDPRPGVQAAEARAAALPARKAALQKRWAAYPLIDVGGGPWRVLEDCPAPRHNTGVAGRGRSSDGRGKQKLGVKCICPRAVELVAEYRRKERARRAEVQRAPIAAPPVPAELRKGGAAVQRLNAPPADLSAGLCRTAAGVKIADAVIGVPRGRTPTTTAIGNHKRMCAPCTVRERCLAEALRLNIPDGIYGGMTAKERATL